MVTPVPPASDSTPATRRLRDTLGRETRDTLFMLAIIGWTVAPHLLRLPLSIGALCCAVLGWRAWLAWREAPLPGRWSLIAVLALASALTWLSERTLVGKEAGVTLLVMLMALKTLELRARRDALVVFFLGFFLVLTQFIYSQSLVTALVMALSVWGWLTALTLAHMPAGRPSLQEAGRLSLRAALLGTPLMVALFLFFPRIAPLWGMATDSGRSGLSEELRFGDVADLALDDSVAMRIRFDGPAPPPSSLYFRGPVLSQYDGDSWKADPLFPVGRPQPALAQPEGSGTTASIGYELTVEPLRVHWLPLLEFTREPPETAPAMETLVPPQDDSMQWRLRAPLGERVRLHAQATLRSQRASGPRLPQAKMLLQLPPGRHIRTRAWARALAEQPELRDANASLLANAVLKHIRTDGFSYTLSPGPYEADTIDEFWLDRKLGFCEHYATAFVVIMRSLGVPARVVTGYQGSDPTPVDGYYVVRQSHAHAWAEFWQAGRGWQRADPTAAVAPDRIQQSRQLAAPKGLLMGSIDAISPGLLKQWRQWVEAVDNRWNQWVLGYGSQQQYKLLDKLGENGSDRWALLRWLVIGVSLLGLAGAGWAWWDGRRQSPWQRIQAGMNQHLRRLGIDAQTHQSPGALAALVERELGPLAQPLAQSLEQLQRLRYAPGSAGPTELRHWWRGFRAAAASVQAARRPKGQHG